MKGNENIAQILKDDYGIDNLTPYEEIEYEIEHYTEELSRVKIQSKTGHSFCCPVYAMFDGYHMNWYGDYGSWGFDCTWKTDVMNLAYGSPYYQLEKLVSRARAEFNDDKCESELMKRIREGDWYTDDLTDEQKQRFEKFMSEPFDYIGYKDEDCLYEYEEECEKLKELKDASVDEHTWYSAVNRLEDSDVNLLSCEQYELYGIGNKAPSRFFIILYMLSVVANEEKSKNPTEKGGAE